jgi:hypothetical protein
VTGWTPDELTVLASADSLRLAAGHEPGPEVELGMVVVRGELYVRAYRGPQSRWFQAAQEAGRGRIRVGTIARDVLLVAAPGPADAIDAAYRGKYGSSSTLVASPRARAAAVRINPGADGKDQHVELLLCSGCALGSQVGRQSVRARTIPAEVPCRTSMST